MDQSLNKQHWARDMFSPRSLAVVGASTKKGSIGNTLLTNFLTWPLKGNVYAVNPKGEPIEGFPCYKTIGEIPEDIDLAMIATPAQFVYQSVKEACEKKVKYMIIFSAGFAEAGEEGKKMQKAISEMCRNAGVRVVGPNAMGLYNFVDNVILTFSRPVYYASGNIGLVSQSGATASGLITELMHKGIGASYVGTTGNQMDISTIDFLEFMVQDESTDILVNYTEAVPDTKRLSEVTQQALKLHKPLIMLKAGKSAAGQKAAMSHTASLTGSHQVFEMAVKKNGVITVDDLAQITNCLKAFRSGKRPKGRRVATMVWSGASGIMCADKLTEYGLEMPQLSSALQAKMHEIVPEYCSLVNPVDYASTWGATPEIIPHCLDALATSDEIDAILIFVAEGNKAFSDAVIKASQNCEKPIICIMSITGGETEKLLTANCIPAYGSISEAIYSLSKLVEYEERYNEFQIESNNSDESSQVIAPYAGDLPVTEPDVKKLLSQYGIAVPKNAFGTTAEELVAHASDLQYPVVAKIVSKDITHKSDVGGVVLKIQNSEELAAAFEKIIASVKEKAPGKTWEGIMAEEMVQGDFLETIVGVTRDPSFGPVIMCGLGGIYVEVMKDVSQGLPPLTKKDAEKMLSSLKSYPVFKGIRKSYSYDIDAFTDTLVKISNMVQALGDDWTDFEINPLIVKPEGHGVMALDGVLTVKK